MKTPSLTILRHNFICLTPIIMILLSGPFATAHTGSVRSPQATLCIKVSADTLFQNVELAVGMDSVQCITVTNCGDTTEVLNALTGLGDYTVTPKTSPPLEPDSSFTFCVTFAPKNIGDKHAFLFINIGALQDYISLTGSTPCANLMAAPVAFGEVIVGQNAIKSVTIANTGDYYWKPRAGYFNPDNGVFSVVNPDFDTLILSPHQTISVTILYEPKAFEKDSSTLSFPNAGPCGNDLQIPVSGEGGCAFITEESYSHPLTGIGETSRFTINISNSGNIDWNPGIGVITGTDSAAFKLISIVPQIVLAGKQSVLTIEFTPTLTGDAHAEVTFPNSGPCSKFYSTVDLSGEGACDDLIPDYVDIQWAVIGHTKRFTVGIRNMGPLSWKAGIPIISGPGASAFKLISVAPDSVAPGGSVTITLELTSTETITYTATLTFPNSSPCLNKPVSISLKGGGEVDAVKTSSLDNIVLAQNFPNPFSIETTFEYTTLVESEIHLTLNDLSGRGIRTIISGRVSEGKHTVNLNLHELPSAKYFLILESGGKEITRELILAK